MKNILSNIQSGKFVRDWMLENKVEQIAFKTMRKQSKEHQIEKVRDKLRSMMPWIKNDKTI